MNDAVNSVMSVPESSDLSRGVVVILQRSGKPAQAAALSIRFGAVIAKVRQSLTLYQRTFAMAGRHRLLWHT